MQPETVGRIEMDRDTVSQYFPPLTRTEGKKDTLQTGERIVQEPKSLRAEKAVKSLRFAPSRNKHKECKGL